MDTAWSRSDIGWTGGGLTVGLDVPKLSDREYEALVEEARKLIPAYSDEWTNFNPADPGITILEMLAWLTETYTYQLDAVTDEHRAKYLELMGEHPRPPAPASARLALDPPPDLDGMTLPEGTPLTVIDGSGTEQRFETTDSLVLTDARVAAVVSENDDGRTVHTHANETEGMFYRPFGDEADVGNAVYFGFDGDPFAAAETLSITIDFHDEDLPEPARHGAEEPEFEPSVDLVWEYCTDYEAAERDTSWRVLDVETDTTDSFYGSGTVTMAAPGEWSPADWDIADADVMDIGGGFVWCRCRVADAGYEIPPQFNSVRLNSVEASHRTTVTDQRLERRPANGDPRTLTAQRYHFPQAPILEADVTVDGEQWTEVADFDASQPTDTHFVLERSAGVVRFGDGVRGRMPSPDATVRAERYVYGGGSDGNVTETAYWQFAEDATIADDGTSLADIDIVPAEPATGGTDAESIEGAFERVQRDLRKPFRAVTVEDYRELANRTPGLRVGRSTVLVDESPRDATTDATWVTVVVVPYSPPDLNRPEPSEGFLRAVQDHLDTHRLLGDRVSVVAPTYVGLRVEADVRTTRWYPQPRAETAIEAAIREYVDPIRGYDGDGWPFGRTLYKENLVAVVAGLDWVDTVRNLSVQAHGDATIDSQGNVSIGDDALLYLDELRAEVQTITRRDQEES